MKEYKKIFNSKNKIDEKYIKLSDIIFEDKIINYTVPLGVEKSSNKKMYIDFNDISCLLVGGETGSGKSVFLNSIITTLILNNKNIEFVMMDPKKIELYYYKDLNKPKTILSDQNECFDELKSIYVEYRVRKNLINDYENLDDFNKDRENKMNHIFVIIDESCMLMEIEESEDILYNMINDSCKYGIHFIIASNSIWKKYFSKKFINHIKYIITFDLADEKEAKMIGNVKAKELEAPGNALVIDDIEYKEFDIQTPYISDEEIKKAIDFANKNN